MRLLPFFASIISIIGNKSSTFVGYFAYHKFKRKVDKN
jgi:hypothetical protein